MLIFAQAFLKGCSNPAQSIKTFLKQASFRLYMVKAVFFDFWGTLVENGTYSPLRQSYNLLHSRLPFGIFVERFENALMTESFDSQQKGFENVCNTFPIHGKPAVIEKLIGVWNKNRLLASVYEDVEPSLKALKDAGFKIYIVSNSQTNSIDPVLEKFNLNQFFDGIFTSFKYGKLKTEGLFEIALNEAGLNKEDAVMVGDSILSDIKGAENIGMRAILIDRKDNRDYEGKIVSLSELKGALENE